MSFGLILVIHLFLLFTGILAFLEILTIFNIDVSRNSRFKRCCTKC